MKPKLIIPVFFLLLFLGCQSEESAKMYSSLKLVHDDPRGDFFSINYMGDDFSKFYPLNKHIFKKVSSREECGDSFYFYDKTSKEYFKFIGKKGDVFIRPLNR